MYHILLYSKSSDRGNQRELWNIKGTQAIMEKAEEQVSRERADLS